uniref:Uncharacterized protein n=1 Tax=Spongospora subterranea TaxID=70186 RepID=A0A0H5R5C9_9EUKA|eukprot:CRZ09370.1 hypothetical protein [Spongospora subterranea]
MVLSVILFSLAFADIVLCHIEVTVLKEKTVLDSPSPRRQWELHAENTNYLIQQVADAASSQTKCDSEQQIAIAPERKKWDLGADVAEHMKNVKQQIRTALGRTKWDLEADTPENENVLKILSKLPVSTVTSRFAKSTTASSFKSNKARLLKQAESLENMKPSNALIRAPIVTRGVIKAPLSAAPTFKQPELSRNVKPINELISKQAAKPVSTPPVTANTASLASSGKVRSNREWKPTSPTVAFPSRIKKRTVPSKPEAKLATVPGPPAVSTSFQRRSFPRSVFRRLKRDPRKKQLSRLNQKRELRLFPPFQLVYSATAKAMVDLIPILTLGPQGRSCPRPVFRRLKRDPRKRRTHRINQQLAGHTCNGNHLFPFGPGAESIDNGDFSSPVKHLD